MKTVKEIWSIQQLIDNKKSIDPRPQYQRTGVWNTDRKAYLIDSILRGYDLPKFYFSFYDNKNAKGFEFEVVDGQQRIRAIWDFYDDIYPLKKNTEIDGINLSSLKFSMLPEIFKNAFKDYELNVTNILLKNPGEVNDLFTRLQKGVSLNPTELRHAMISNIGSYIDKFVTRQQTNGFFGKDSKITDMRFKHQEYIDHIIALAHYGHTKDLKAVTIAQLYIDYADSDKQTFVGYFQKASIVLNTMGKINSFNKGIFKNKWAFVDTFWLLFKNISKIPSIDFQSFSNLFLEFEVERKKYNDKPETVLTKKSHKFGSLLFDYIQAFNKEGAKKENLVIRADVFDKVFEHLL